MLGSCFENARTPRDVFDRQEQIGQFIAETYDPERPGGWGSDGSTESDGSDWPKQCKEWKKRLDFGCFG